ncbi:hypothetical protein K491DRAFT_719082 [Lophiostoma macrostomum CBS 122681]|uniref:Uncharacterized protein n=1 Tax=Lophiostoma macrostomum CBS 122681 TaxID=1314788 RepID=A0A6A6T0B8_9PLEO|nr:hypothetical protein K491DRAFT_719082 [Lophiostoma macrostomum CBS 122681]
MRGEEDKWFQNTSSMGSRSKNGDMEQKIRGAVEKEGEGEEQVEKELGKVSSVHSRADEVKTLEDAQKEMQNTPKTSSSDLGLPLRDDADPKTRPSTSRQSENDSSISVPPRPTSSAAVQVQFSYEQVKALVDGGLFRTPTAPEQNIVSVSVPVPVPTSAPARDERDERNSRPPALRTTTSNSRLPVRVTGKEAISQTFPPTRDRHREPCRLERMVSAAASAEGSRQSAGQRESIVKRVSLDTQRRATSQQSMIPEILTKSTAASIATATATATATALATSHAHTHPHFPSHTTSHPHTHTHSPETSKNKHKNLQRSLDSLPRENRTSLMRAATAAKLRKEHDGKFQTFPSPERGKKRCNKPALPDEARGSRSGGLEEERGKGSRLPVLELFRRARAARGTGEGGDVDDGETRENSSEREMRGLQNEEMRPKEEEKERDNGPAPPAQAHHETKEKPIDHSPLRIEHEEKETHFEEPSPQVFTAKSFSRGSSPMQADHAGSKDFSPKVVRFAQQPQRPGIFPDWMQQEAKPGSVEEAATQPHGSQQILVLKHSKCSRSESLASSSKILGVSVEPSAENGDASQKSPRIEESVKHDSRSPMTHTKEAKSTNIGGHCLLKSKSGLDRSRWATVEDIPDEPNVPSTTSKGKREIPRGRPDPSTNAKGTLRVTDDPTRPSNSNTVTIALEQARDDPLGLHKWLQHNPNNDNHDKQAIKAYIPSGAPNSKGHAKRKVHFETPDTRTVEVKTPAGFSEYHSATKHQPLGDIIPGFQYLPTSKSSHAYSPVSYRSSPPSLRRDAPSPQRLAIRNVSNPDTVANLISPEVRTLMDKVDRDNSVVRAERGLQQRARTADPSGHGFQDGIKRECAARMEQINRETEIRERAAIAALRQRREEEDEEKEQARRIEGEEQLEEVYHGCGQREEGRRQRRRARRGRHSQERRECEATLSSSSASKREGADPAEREQPRSGTEEEHIHDDRRSEYPYPDTDASHILFSTMSR